MHNDAKPTTALTRKAVVLLSGGVDSTTALAIARSEGFRVWAISFDYGQRHRFELEAARQIAATFGVEDHRIVQCDLRTIGGSALTDSLEVPKDRAESTDIPITYVPARNTIFLSLALGYAEVCGVQTIVIGANAVDYSGYPDCRPEYLEAFERLANLATKAGAVGQPFHIWAPLLHMTKAEIIRTGVKLGVDYRMTFSCYDPDSIGRACGHCDSCRIRKRGFADAGVPDPTSYLAGERGKP